MITDHSPITVLAIPFFLITLALEAGYLSKRARRKGLLGYEGRDTRTSLLMGIGSLVTGLLIIIVDVPISLWAWNHKLFDLGDGWIAWIVALLAWDFAYYWYHRTGHRVRLLWANHVQHHSSEHYNLSTALRQPVTSFTEWLFFPTLALLGVPPWMIFASGGINLLYQYWIHTETITKLPAWFELFFNTPSHHRVHHGSNQEYLDKNYGGILIIWDRLFGTFEPERAPVVYGLTKNINTFNVWNVATHEYRALGRDAKNASGLKNKLGHILMPPGWTPKAAAAPATEPVGA